MGENNGKAVLPLRHACSKTVCCFVRCASIQLLTSGTPFFGGGLVSLSHVNPVSRRTRTYSCLDGIIWAPRDTSLGNESQNVLLTLSLSPQLGCSWLGSRERNESKMLTHMHACTLLLKSDKFLSLPENITRIREGD